MSSSGPFGFDPEDFDRVVREAGEGLREVLDGLGRFMSTSERSGWSALFGEFTRPSGRHAEPPTTGDTGDGVWAIYTVDDAGGAHIEQVYPTELDALRANKNNTDPKRRVRFLPYGIAVSVLDATGSHDADRDASDHDDASG
ncbi:hypothetical protein CRI77_21290 [Mycolicibacterium duvalii]|uniref:Uncharacterized protein n=1 Tax=Mycolicibacterium duvalii TaxID=39688 RepID=A0A7I7JZ56_9MYCO|nr:hypothetical protein [Mycolicibacterium duvalii]MCV7370331.1 hypothetical protein [Mycolicibacterium duvalii]PEG37298.1 hypothetical protein CRI77_21290 [Mycolicibacterium duvalii]BBX16491.1 hypothetical protein MDUV_13510 [Mycolicibacterium duvalii]